MPRSDDAEQRFEQLAENLRRAFGLSYKEILKLSGKELPSRFHLPLAIFTDRRLGPLEAAVVHLKERGLRHVEIAKLLNRDQRTIWTTYQKARRKLDES